MPGLPGNVSTSLGSGAGAGSLESRTQCGSQRTAVRQNIPCSAFHRTIGNQINSIRCVGGGTFDVLCQGLPGVGVLDAVSTPGREELDQPGRGRVRDARLQAAAAQDHQRVLLRVQAGGGSHTPGDEPQDDRGSKPQPEHPCRPAGKRREENVREPESFHRGRAERAGRTWEQLLGSRRRVFPAESEGADRRLTLSAFLPGFLPPSEAGDRLTACLSLCAVAPNWRLSPTVAGIRLQRHGTSDRRWMEGSS